MNVDVELRLADFMGKCVRVCDKCHAEGKPATFMLTATDVAEVNRTDQAPCLLGHRYLCVDCWKEYITIVGDDKGILEKVGLR